MSPARHDINELVIPMFARKFTKGGRILFVGVDPVWDYKDQFPNCIYETLDKDKKRKPDILGDIQNCPQIENETYDGIIMTGVYEYLTEHEKAFREIYRILKPDGMLLLCAPGIMYYGNTKPWVTIETLPQVLKNFQIMMLFVTYYTSREPYYIHTFAQK